MTVLLLGVPLLYLAVAVLCRAIGASEGWWGAFTLGPTNINLANRVEKLEKGLPSGDEAHRRVVQDIALLQAQVAGMIRDAVRPGPSACDEEARRTFEDRADELRQRVAAAETLAADSCAREQHNATQLAAAEVKLQTAVARGDALMADLAAARREAAQTPEADPPLKGSERRQLQQRISILDNQVQHLTSGYGALVGEKHALEATCRRLKAAAEAQVKAHETLQEQRRLAEEAAAAAEARAARLKAAASASRSSSPSPDKGGQGGMRAYPGGSDRESKLKAQLSNTEIGRILLCASICGGNKSQRDALVLGQTTDSLGYFGYLNEEQFLGAKAEHKRLSLLVHPDKVPADVDPHRAAEAFAILSEAFLAFKTKFSSTYSL